MRGTSSLLSLVRFIAIAALLIAQQTALSHPLAHLDGKAGHPKQERLCDFHGTLGSMLGAIDGTPAAVEVPACGPLPIDAALRPALSAAGLTPSSRDPPEVL